MKRPLPDDPKEPTMLGKLFSAVRSQRWLLREQALSELWKRNGLENPKLRDGYKVAETAEVHKGGKEIIEYRLYKLVDSVVTTLDTSVKGKVEAGLDKLKENQK